MVILLGAARPYLMASAMASLGSENPSWAQRNGRINSSGNLLQKEKILLLCNVKMIKRTLEWGHLGPSE